MPVECSIDISPLDQDAFHSVDKRVMRHAFDIHNTLGRFCDERTYQKELTNRCREAGMIANPEIEIRASHRDFHKSYYLDLLIEHGTIYELKTTKSLTETHKKQLINYLLLTGVNHGKIINFRPRSVESLFVSTHLSKQDRAHPEIDESRWHGTHESCEKLKLTLHHLLEDWGTFLDSNLYKEALLHFTAKPGCGIQPIDIQINGRTVGTQHMALLEPQTAWHLSANRSHLDSYELHIKRLLNHTNLNQFHWINLNHRSVTLKTLRR